MCERGEVYFSIVLSSKKRDRSHILFLKCSYLCGDLYFRVECGILALLV